ncbi:hypothetical protein N0V93_005262 [Gnomoniopsis smithogilvyi]|uniref:DUF3074 domain-containing protein n=1 Tax=Gnomoniopsis smithogilvyi TaxID=1191159 RepID=A0A9W8YUF4_9PEZI|nr:hypothetical protein N0V93_005262 [Gnomoniopsis smithogilvyi]
MAHHEPLKALGPIDWSDVTSDDLKHFLTSNFFQAQTVIDSIPTPPSQAKPAQHGRARSHTDSSIAVPHDASSNRSGREHANTTAADETKAAAHVALLQKEWKEVKVPPKDNPMDITVYKLASKDGRGAWFARRSLHEGIPFEKFRLGLEREFGETMKNSTGVGTGNVRGIGAERTAEHVVCDGVGKAEVWVLSAQFPGPTTPRDFITLLLTGSGEAKTSGKEPRQYMVISKPCIHPECAPRAGYIRGSYESVEIIREVPIEKSLRRTRSSVDVRSEDRETLEDQDNLSKEAKLRAASSRAARESEQSLPRSMTELPPHEADIDSGVQIPGPDMAVEWIMVTRSDPGGSVPRFMVEKGTPGGIVNDAGRFTKWLETKSAVDFDESTDSNIKGEAVESEHAPALPPRPGQESADLAVRSKPAQSPVVEDDVPPSGLYSMITGLVGGAASAVANHLPHITYPSGHEAGLEASDGSDSDSDSDSGHSFASAQEPEPELDSALAFDQAKSKGGDLTSLRSAKSDDSSTKPSTTQHEKQLKKLQERYRKIEEKMAKQQERSLQGKQNQTDDDALAKLKEKHEKEVARQAENFRKETRKLEEKRLKEEKKVEERRRKEAEKEARGNLAMELERTKVERDMAFKQIDILKEQVGELQSQNTKLVAKLGKLGNPSKSDEILGNGNGV